MPELKPQVYLDARPAERFGRFHAWARAHDPDWVYLFARIVLAAPCLLLFRLRARGRGNVPGRGPVLLAPNHFSIWDHFFCGLYLRRRIRFMAKSQLYANPLLEAFLTHAGAFPVRRGRRDEDAIATARAILERGGAVVVYPEGPGDDRIRSAEQQAAAERIFAAVRTMYERLAASVPPTDRW